MYLYFPHTPLVIYCECVFTALGIQRAMRMRHIVTCDLSGSTTFFGIITLKARFKKKRVIVYKNTCFNFLYNFYPKYFSFEEVSEVL